MDNQKFEKIIELIINENDEQRASELFHELVVEKSREIYENIMMDEMMADDMDEGMGGQVGDMMDEINAEEAGGMVEAEDDMEMEFGDEDEIVDIDSDDESATEEHEELEDAVVRIEDKLDQLMAEFEEIMAGDEEGEEEFGDEEGDDEGEEEFGDEEGEEDFGDEEGEEDFGDEEESVMENVQLKQVPGLYGSKIGGDDGANSKSPTLSSPKVKAAGVNPVKFSGDSEAVPTSPKGPNNYGSKGETSVKGAGQFKNTPGQDAGKSSFKEKVAGGFGHKTPQGKEVGAGGSVQQNDKSVLESRKSVKKIVK